MYVPVHIRRHCIYDIIHNDENKLVIITPGTQSKLHVKVESDVFEYIKCPHGHTCIYTSKLKYPYKNKIELIVNNEVFETTVSKYPSIENEVIMSTIVKNEDKYILQWINYYCNLGIRKFIIYDNADKSELNNILKDFIKMGIVVLIKWDYPYYLEGHISGQTTQQNHSIHTFRNCRYIGLLDVDEYLNLQKDEKFDTLVQKVIVNRKLDINNVGSFRILSKNFYNPYNENTEGYNFLKIYYCGNVIRLSNEKQFVIPKNVKTFSVHMITSGKQMITIGEDEVYFNHYVFLNKKNRGKDKTTKKDESIMRHASVFF